MAISAAIWLGWLGLFGVLELASLTRRVPWMPLSDFTWKLENVSAFVPWLLIVGLGLLTAHLVWRVGWPPR